MGDQKKRAIFQRTGIAVGVGFGKTKTLAKIANHLAKKLASGVANIHDYNEDKVLNTINVESLWGVGKGFQVD